MTKKIYNPGDLIGTWQLEVVEEIEPHISLGGTRHRKFKVKCPKCGKIFETYLNDLNRSINGSKKPIKQCPKCSAKYSAKQMSVLGKKNIKDLTGQRFGNLLVLGDSRERSKSGHVIWTCQCICGNITKVRGVHLVNGNITSCGCRTESKGEEKIRLILNQLELNFKQEKIFNDCINPKTNAKLRFDFYLPDHNICIEYDGKQHFKNTGWGNEHLKETQYRDNIKNKFCMDNGIKLIRIPYTDYDKLSINYLEQLIKN